MSRAAADLFLPARGAAHRGSAVLLLPAIAGVNDYLRGVGTRLASEGHAVRIVDYFEDVGGPPDISTPEKIGQAVAGLSDVKVMAQVRAAWEGLRAREDVSAERIAVLGFCIGGTYALLAACELPGLAAAVNYYGGVRYGAPTPNKPASPLDRVGELRAPLLSHYGTADRFVPGPDVDALEQALDAAGKVHELCRYGGAPHAFDEHHRPAYRPVAAREAWVRSLAFLDWYTRGKA